MEEAAAGIKLYFNSMLGTQLLYKQEKQQFKEVCLIHIVSQLLQCGNL